MGKISKKKPLKKNVPATPQSLFNEALERYQRLKHQNTQFADDMQSMMARILPQIEPYEIQFLQAKYQLTEKIIPYMSKKTLPDYAREELRLWIFDNFDDLGSMPFSSAIDLAPLMQNYEYHTSLHIDNANEKLFKKMANNGVSEEEINEVRSFTEKMNNASTKEEHDALFEEAFGNLNTENDQNDMSDEDDFFESLFGDEQTFTEDDSTHDTSNNHTNEELEHKKLTKLFSQSAINKLFRRMSRALHPDLEQDSTKKEEKHHKMVALIDARDQKDIAYILQAYKEIFGQLPESFPEEDYTQLLPLIEHMIEKIKKQRQDVFNEIPFSENVYTMFYDKNIKKENIKINKHIKHLEEQAKAIQEEIQEISSISALRERIASRNLSRLDFF
ncbi:hypothetical protein [Marinagarivorans algicola]|uniref:hypothetical protein n=1 Tax=Marinagarivorans algicola TaxID=1513270 RepID=UPI0012E2414E|nr:hypothetical protein [Marinagarivorans algicola]